MAQLQIVHPSGEHSIYDLVDEKTSIGRLADNAIQIDDQSVSSHHAEIHLEGDTYHLHDLGSTNGTSVNEEQMTDAVLQHGDQIRIGAIDMVFEDEENVSEEPLPESATASVEVTKGSTRPPGFASSSPLAKLHRAKDPIAALLYMLVVIGILVFGAAAFYTYQMAAAAV